VPDALVVPGHHLDKTSANKNVIYAHDKNFATRLQDTIQKNDYASRKIAKGTNTSRGDQGGVRRQAGDLGEGADVVLSLTRQYGR
jgi:hypothetical protein